MSKQHKIILGILATFIATVVIGYGLVKSQRAVTTATQQQVEQNTIPPKPIVADLVPHKIDCGDVSFKWDQEQVQLTQNDKVLVFRPTLSATFNGQITQVSCDTLGAEHKNLLRLDTYSGGNHCCSKSFWFDVATNKVWALDLEADFSSDQDFVGPGGNKIIKAQAATLAGFKSSSGAVDLCYAESPYLPAAYCFTNNGFKDCSAEHADYQTALLAAQTEIKKYTAANTPNSLLVEYLALIKIIKRQDLYNNLLQAGYQDKLLKDINDTFDVLFAEAQSQNHDATISMSDFLKLGNDWP